MFSEKFPWTAGIIEWLLGILTFLHTWLWSWVSGAWVWLFNKPAEWMQLEDQWKWITLAGYLLLGVYFAYRQAVQTPVANPIQRTLRFLLMTTVWLPLIAVVMTASISLILITVVYSAWLMLAMITGIVLFYVLLWEGIVTVFNMLVDSFTR